jgi:enterochelin esterase-like enzyme
MPEGDPMRTGVRMMTFLFALVVSCLSTVGVAVQNVAQVPTTPLATSLDDRYVLGADSLLQAGVPVGTVSEFTLEHSETYPGYSHRWWLYVPAHYDGRTPLALMVFQDGRSFVPRDGIWRVPVVLDNLISKKELPQMAAVFVDPGQPIQPTQMASEQRSFEYDTLSDQYARFLITELLPEVKKRIRVTDNPDGRGIAGVSSGGICAFTVAWQRSDQFHKVFSAIGSFVNIRGGGAYPDIVRQSPRKPLRVFLQDGINNELGGRFRGLNWPDGNRAMAAALALKGYDYQLVMGEGTHTGRHGAAIFPDAMRWLWRDYNVQ